MCTCITFHASQFYFGRNLDLERGFGEKIVITPRNYRLRFRCLSDLDSHFAMIGMANVTEGYPLYAEAANEKGLCIAGLNFPGNAWYQKSKKEKINIASYELIPWILGKCRDAEEAAELLRDSCVTDDAFSERLTPAPLHWMLADQKRCYVVEPVKEGVKLYQNPVGVLTNNPPFPYHRENIRNYQHLTANPPENQFAGDLGLTPYGEGMGAVGLPGDASPASRFVRAAFLRWNSVCDEDAWSEISQFFHILDGVSMVKGSVRGAGGECETTIYTCCICPEEGSYYYKTYDNPQIHGVKMSEKNLKGSSLSVFEAAKQQEIVWQDHSVCIPVEL